MSAPRFALPVAGGELDAALAAGFAGVVLDRAQAEDPAVTEALKSSGLALAAVSWQPDLTDGHGVAMALNGINGFLDAAAAAGTQTLVVAAPSVPERARVAGRVTEAGARGLRDDEWQNLADALNELGERCKARGLALAYLPRAGTWVETANELKKLMSLTDSGLVGLALDTGHAAYSGWDALQALDTYRWRLRLVTFQDLDPAVREVAQRHGLDLAEARRRGLFPAVGAGKLDLGAIAAKLAELEFDGWVAAAAPGDHAQLAALFGAAV